MFSKSSKWIALDKKYDTPVVVKKFTAGEIKNAVIDISGLGYYELFINGVRVSDEYFKPVCSDYLDRDFSNYGYPLFDKTSHTIYYNTYSVTPFIKRGENTMVVMLGNGFFRQTRRNCEGDTRFLDELILRFDLKITQDGVVSRIVSDGTEKVGEGFIKSNNLYYGEVHDYLGFNGFADFDASDSVSLIKISNTKIRKQNCPNDKIVSIRTPKIVTRNGNNVVYDVGANISGFVRFTAKSEEVTVRHAEQLIGYRLDFGSAGGDWQISQNVYRNAQGLTVHPYFSWSGFRYFEIEGEVENVEVCVVHTDIKVTSHFECGNETLNWLYNAFVDTLLYNMHGGIPSDCPHRERLGYTGDGQLTAESAMMLVDGDKFYRKWIRDIADCQDINSGHIQHTAPLMGGGGGPGGWGSAMVIVPYAHYKIHGDKSVLEEYFDNMTYFLESMHGFCENGLIVKEREKGWCLGDWCTPGEVILPRPLVNTYYYVRCMQLVSEIASVIGKKVDYSSEIERAKNALVREYFDKTTGDFANGVQGANAFMLVLGLGDERTKSNLLSNYETRKSFDTGIFGTDVLMQYLTQAGETQLAFDLLSSEKYPSFGNCRARGATTLWEYWEGNASNSHPMFGGCVKQIFYGLLGVSGDAGMKNITLAPKYIEGMGYAKAKLKLSSGTLSLSYKYKDGKVQVFAKTSGKINLKIIN